MSRGEKIGVIGAGVMGTDVAFDLASAGYEVVLKDVDAFRLDEAKSKIATDFRMYRMMKSHLKSLTKEDILNRIDFTTTYDDFPEIGVVIENVPEEWNIKQEVYQTLNSICGGDTMYCVNTSCTSITKVASLVDHPENVIGMHFMNPVPLKDIVELIRGYHTSEETIETAKSFLKTLNKSTVVANDLPGFIANRLSHLLMNEAAFLVQDQVATAKDVDVLFRKGYGHNMGPLETADLIGLDTVIHSLEVLYEEYQDSKFRCCPLLKKMVRAGLKGRKSGEGFYKYGA